ncbi:MAG TPA: nucleoside hydrolase [Nocardioidaceae bacterium]|nr:nucleoside hydrolase [Nocardioidaceae bacterium]
MRLHIDSDLGDDPDDACALVMTLGWPGVEVSGITTVDDPDGRRADLVRELLAMLGATDVPVASGGSTPRAAADLLTESIEAGARLVAIGPYTNLAHLERSLPGALTDVPVVTMGGWVDALPDGYPSWGPARDRNAQHDVDAALTLFGSHADLTFVPCAAAVTATLRTADLARLSAAGPCGSLLARQSVGHGEENGYRELASRHAALPADLVNFHWDPVTCAVAAGWPGATVTEMDLRPVLDQEVLRFERHPEGRRTRVVTAVDGAAFRHRWLDAIEAAERRMPTDGAGTTRP